MKKLAIILAALVAGACAVTASAAVTGNDVTGYAIPSVLTGHKGGSGASIDVIVDGIRPEDGVGTNQDQRDTFGGATEEHEEAFIMTYEKEIEFTAVEWTEGMHFGDGGWFGYGVIKCQVLQGENWVDVKLTNEVNYPNGTTQAEFLPNFETYTFEFEPIKGTAIRIAGTAVGAGQFFTSCSEFTVYANEDPANLTTYADQKAAAEAAAAAAALAAGQLRANETGYIEQISTPITTYDDMADNVGGGTKTLSTINDGVFPAEPDAAVPQFDTICNEGRWIPYHNEWIGYEFPANYTVESVEFYEGGNFFDGGFFADGDIYLEALINGEWVKVDSTVDPEYPVADDQESHFPAYQCFTFTLATPTACDGIRVSGSAGGSAAFISCSEIMVKTVFEAPVVEEPVVEEPVVEEPVVEEPVVEEPVVEEVVETPVVDAPQTFDAAIIAAVAAVVSLAGYAVSKKR